MVRNISGLVEVTGVESRLAAAGLALWVVDRVAESLKYVDHCDADSGRKLVNVTGNKERDFQRGTVCCGYLLQLLIKDTQTI